MRKPSKIHEKFYISNSSCCPFSLGTFRVNVFKLPPAATRDRDFFSAKGDPQVTAQTKQLVFKEKIQNLTWDVGQAEQG